MDLFFKEILDGASGTAGGCTGAGTCTGGCAGAGRCTGGCAGGVMGGASGPAGVPYRNIHYINKNKCIGGVPIRVSSLLGIFLRMFDLVFFHNLFALDHTASTVGTTVLPSSLGAPQLGQLGKYSILVRVIFFLVSCSEPKPVPPAIH